MVHVAGSAGAVRALKSSLLRGVLRFAGLALVSLTAMSPHSFKMVMASTF